ncbi:MAG: hypothetical protein IPK72_18780 [Candidatus Eisenbacteria bacterium]|nr:hypothetical protein [Candidatus Eisenbacteria bacterium]
MQIDRPAFAPILICLLSILALVGLPGCSHRESLSVPMTPEVAAEWTTRLHGRSVAVGDTTGVYTLGRDLAFSTDAVTLSERGQPRSIPLAVVKTLRYRDRGEGMRRGATRFGVPGLAAGLVLGALLAGQDLCLENCGESDPSPWERLGRGIAGAALLGTAGAAIGIPLGAGLFAWREVSVSQ